MINQPIWTRCTLKLVLALMVTATTGVRAETAPAGAPAPRKSPGVPAWGLGPFERLSDYLENALGLDVSQSVLARPGGLSAKPAAAHTSSDANDRMRGSNENTTVE